MKTYICHTDFSYILVQTKMFKVFIQGLEFKRKVWEVEGKRYMCFFYFFIFFTVKI